MSPRPIAAALTLLLFALALAPACGARSTLHGEDPTDNTTDPDAGADGASAERHCPPECVVGHRCCAGGCGGPVVIMPSDCCTCLPGEVSSWDCPAGTCGN